MYATFVLPAPRGCNLNCPYCAVALRNEAHDIKLVGKQYIWFLDETLRFKNLKKVSIVGYEPTLDDVVALTISMLKKSKAIGIETSMNTNGLNFPKYAGPLAEVVDTVMMSLDSHLPETNDRMRGMKGTFAGTTAAIRCAIADMGPERVIVNTLLLPNRLERIEGMPNLLAYLGVKLWVISPYIDFREGKLLPDVAFIKEVVMRLASKAAQTHINAMYADEFRVIGKINGIPPYNFHRPGELNEFVFRLAPNGTCSVGDEILTDSSVARVWDGKLNPATFLRSLIPALSLEK